MKEKEFGDLLVGMMQNKELLAKSIMDCLGMCQKTNSGCRKVVENWDSIKESPANMEKQLLTAIKTNQRLTEAMMQVLVLQLTYVMGDQHSADAGKALNQMGRGREAVREMFKSKLGKKGFDDMFKGKF